MTTLAGLVRSFAALLTPHAGNGSLLQQWIATARAADLPHLHAFTNGLDLDIQATRLHRDPEMGQPGRLPAWLALAARLRLGRMGR